MEIQQFPVEIDDPAALAQRCAQVRGCGGEPWLFVHPTTQPEVESKGMFGKRKVKAANWGATVSDHADANDAPHWMIWMTLPDGPPVAARGVALPDGASVDIDGGGELLVMLAPGATADVVAAETCRLLRALVADHVDGGWSGEITDSNRRGYDASFGFS